MNRGRRALRRLLREQTFDLRRLDAAGFRRWLEAHLQRWRSDPVFVRRSRIRDLRREHPELAAAEKACRRAARLADAAPQAEALRRLERDLSAADRAVAGLSAALEREPDRAAVLRGKLDAFLARRRLLREERDGLLRSCPASEELRRADADLTRLRAASGLDRAEDELAELLQRQGRRSGRSGASFEDLARTLTRDLILPELVRGDEAAARRLRVLCGVTLGAARTELDQVVVRVRQGGAVEALAVVEVKRNLNDLAHGFRQRQENLAWLTGNAGGYDAAAYRTARFRAGHFDRAATHEQDGEAFVFAPGSFRRFRRDAARGLFLDRLYFIARSGPLWGVSSAALARVAFRAATDPRWAPEDAIYLGELLDWCRALADPAETPDVLAAYLSTPRRARQVLLADV